ncbi:MAG: glycosyltransferase family 4 protein [Pirellulaceae bacterium]
MSDFGEKEPRPPVLLVGNFLSQSIGNRCVCEDLAERLTSRGWPLLTTSEEPRRLLRLVDMLRTIWRKRHEYAVAQVDVYSGDAFIWAEAAGWFLRRLRKPYVLTLHGGNLPAFSRRWPRRVQRLLAGAEAVTTPSRYLQETMQSFRTDMELIPNALDVQAYEYRHRLVARPRLVWLRAFHHIYNPAMAPRVLARLVGEFPDIQLLMVGPDKADGSRQEMERTAQSLGVRDRIAVPGKVTKASIGDWLNRGDVFLNTTNFDNTPVSVMEAMACGLCVVSTNVGGIPYLVRSGYDALTVSPDRDDEMANAVRRILQNSSLCATLSRNARATAEPWDWSPVLDRWDEILRGVARC